MHSMVGSFSPYKVKRQRVEMVRGYCYRFFSCSFPCGIVMLILSILFILVGSIQLIYIMHLNGCTNISTTTSTSFKCNRQTMKVLGITFVVTGSVLFFISILITKYSRSSEENNVIRAPTSALLPNNTKATPLSHYPHTSSSSKLDQNHMIISIQ